MRERRFLKAAALTALMAMLAGCARSETAPDPGRFVGQSLATALENLGSPNVIDVSESVVGIQPAYNGGADPAEWIVVVGCYAPNPQHASDVAVIPKASVTAAIRAAAKRGEFDRYVPSCDR